MKRAILTVVIAVLVCAGPSAAQTGDHDIDEIIKKMDELYRSESSWSEIEMQIVTPHWERTLTMEAWTEGMEKTLIRVHSPRKEKGMGTLRIDREMWNYLPKVNKVIKVPPSMMSSSWMGSDFTNDDIVSEVTLVDDYDVEFTTAESPEPGLLYLKATPHEGVPVVWGYYVMAITDDTYLPVWEKYYDEKGRLMRSSWFSDVRTFDGRTLPTVMEMIPHSESKKGNKTVVRYSNIKFDTAIDDDVFTLRNLRTVR